MSAAFQSISTSSIIFWGNILFAHVAIYFVNDDYMQPERRKRQYLRIDLADEGGLHFGLLSRHNPRTSSSG